MAARLYPDPPHLSATVYVENRPETEVFAELCGVVEAAGGTATGDADDTRTGFDVPRVGLVVVARLHGADGDRAPVAIITYADDLGVPDELWSASERTAAYRLGAWAHDVFRAACLATDPLYGELAVENTLSTPRALGESGDRIGDVYVSDRLLAADDRLGARLREAYDGGAVEEWEGGLYASAWRYLNTADRSATDGWKVSDTTVALLTRAVTKAGLRPYD
ncbi:MAG: hypothetical protein GEV11_06320 [Streptosporangiales bacterium]|nr:hypothetical protein [Streptosporangiales bacterium]